MSLPQSLIGGKGWVSGVGVGRKGAGEFGFLEIEFEVLPNAPRGEVSDLILREAILNNSRSVVRKGGSIEILPDQTALLQNFPNPFNPETWLPYQLAEDGQVTMHLFNLNGQLVISMAMALGHQLAGSYHTREKAAYWDGRNDVGERVASGVYFYQLQVGDFRRIEPVEITATRKLVMLK